MATDARGGSSWRLTIAVLTVALAVAVWSLWPSALGGPVALLGFTSLTVGVGLLTALVVWWRELAEWLSTDVARVVMFTLALAALGFWLVGVGLWGIALPTLLAVTGALLIGHESRSRHDRGARVLSRNGWRAITDRTVAPIDVTRELGGVLLLALAMLAFLIFVGTWVGGTAELALLVVLLAGVLVLALLIGLLARRLSTVGPASGELSDMVSRQAVSAHLHDSVLQTLALIQRKADDPSAVSRLARRQEESLRQWLSGGSQDDQSSLAAALRDAVHQVEDEESILVDVTIMGNRAVEAREEAVVGAVREALRNSARHSDASSISLYVEINEREVEAFVRDDGEGFDQRAVPTERRGICDSIVARMERVGGHARIQSAPGAGTEVQISTERPGGTR